MVGVFSVVCFLAIRTRLGASRYGIFVACLEGTQTEPSPLYLGLVFLS